MIMSHHRFREKQYEVKLILVSLTRKWILIVLVIGVTIVANESCFIFDSLNIPRGGYYGMASPPQILTK